MNFLSSGTVTNSPDLERILALPRRTETDADLEALVDEMTSVLKTDKGTMRLKRIQAQALYEIGNQNGGFIPVSVGGGKTACALLAPHVLDSYSMVLILPAGLITKTKDEAYVKESNYSEHFLVPTNIHMISYEMLGRADYADELERLKPDLIVCDEVHRIKNATAAVTKRVLRYMEANPETRFVALSGTIMDHSILEFAHILRWCLKGNSPVPLSDGELAEWASALDVKAPRGNEFARYEPGALVRLAEGAPGTEGVEDDTTLARIGFRHRLITTPGVVASVGKDSDVKASIRIRGIVYAPTKKEKDPTDEHFRSLRADMLMVNGWDLTTPMEVWGHAREIAMGLSYIWDPKPPDEWRKPRQAWFKFVRSALKESAKYGGSLDSPSQVEAAVRDGSLIAGIPLLDAWLNVKDTFTPNTVPVWHDDFAIDACLKWAKTSGPGIIWTEHTLFAHRLAQKSGLKYYGRKGLAADGERIEKADPRKSLIASADANKEGRNLQMFSRNLITTLEPRAGKNEQLIGRTHRAFQEADEVTVDILIGCLEHLNAMRGLIPAATILRDTTGAEQKVLYADITDWPSESEIAGWTGDRWKPSEADKFVIPTQEQLAAQFAANDEAYEQEEQQEAA